jgi:integrase
VYGTQEVSVPKDLKVLLDKYIKILPKNQEYLFDDKGKKLENFQLTKILNGLFKGRKVSVNLLRHSYLTNLYGDKLHQMKQTATNMGHSLETALNTYVKK